MPPINTPPGKYFSWEEFKSHDGVDVPDTLRIDDYGHRPIKSKADYRPADNVRMLCKKILDPLREQVGPVIITSGFRTVEFNDTLKGAVMDSMHLIGAAADISVPGMTPSEVADYLEDNFHPGGLGRYAGFTHVDIRAGRARW